MIISLACCRSPVTEDPQPLVTIVTPSFNQARFLRAAVESVLSQDYPKIEYIVLDGGSNDGSVEILREFAHRLQWESGPDGGQADALAKGFARAKGSILGWLNADDALLPNAIAEAVAFFKAHPKIGLVYGDAIYIDTADRTVMPCRHVRPFDLARLRYWSDYIVQPSAFFRRSAYEAAGGIDASLRWAMDYDLWLKIARDHAVAYVPRTWSKYRLQGSNKTAMGGFARLAEVEAMIRRHGLGGLPADFRIEKAALYVKEARLAVAEGAPLRALRAYVSAVATIGTSWRAIGRCFSWPLWRDIRRNRAALRRVGIGGADAQPVEPTV